MHETNLLLTQPENELLVLKIRISLTLSLCQLSNILRSASHTNAQLSNTRFLNCTHTHSHTQVHTRAQTPRPLLPYRVVVQTILECTKYCQAYSCTRIDRASSSQTSLRRLPIDTQHPHPPSTRNIRVHANEICTRSLSSSSQSADAALLHLRYLERETEREQQHQHQQQICASVCVR